MITSARATWAVCLATLTLGACSLVVDFDRAKLRGSDGSVGDDAATDGGPDGDGGQPDGGPEGGVDPGGRCQGDDECGPEDLCCDAVCTPARPINGCATCGGLACGDGADSCASRVCACGGGAACSGATPYCAEKLGGAPGEFACVGCRGDTDCGTTQVCAQQQCRDCDHTKGNTGCQNPTPICAEDDTCVACDASHACPSPLSCNPGPQGGCFGCDDSTNQGCDAASTTPVCDAVTGGLQCEGCAADAECAGNASGTQCNMNGACRVCDPRDATNPGCTDAARGFCDENGACRACIDSDCSGSGASRCAKTGQLAGQCVGCTKNDECPATAPTCSGSSGACRACGSNNDCTDSPYGPACNLAGRCVQCTSNAQCGGATPRCDTASNTCVECTSTAQCSGARPICASGLCVACGVAGSDAACAAKNTSLPVCTVSGCVQCTSAATCGDGDACTTDSCSGANTCVHTVVNPADTDACTLDTCNSLTGVAHTPLCAPALCIDSVTGCRPCNPATNAGCADPTPICNASYTCVAAPPAGP
jgi:Dictyostelium (slime mold) repeat